MTDPNHTSAEQHAGQVSPETAVLRQVYDRVLAAHDAGTDPALAYQEPMGPLTADQEQLRLNTVHLDLERRLDAAETRLHQGLPVQETLGPDRQWTGLDGRLYQPLPVGWDDVTHPDNDTAYHDYFTDDQLTDDGFANDESAQEVEIPGPGPAAGAVSWRDIADADAARWDYRVAEARSAAVTADPASTAAQRDDADLAAFGAWGDYTHLVRSRSLAADATLDDWPAVVVADVDRYQLPDEIIGTQQPAGPTWYEQVHGTVTTTDTVRGPEWQALDDAEGRRATDWWNDITRTRTAGLPLTQAQAEDAAVMDAYDRMFDPDTHHDDDHAADDFGW